MGFFFRAQATKLNKAFGILGLFLVFRVISEVRILGMRQHLEYRLLAVCGWGKGECTCTHSILKAVTSAREFERS